MVVNHRPDYIVVGAGSAGCVVARVLAEAGFRVCLIESGSTSPPDPWPSAYLSRFGTDDDWGFQTLPQPQLSSRRLACPRGRGVGGSTRINATIWYPPTHLDMQHLETVGGDFWSVAAMTDALQKVTDWVKPESPQYCSPIIRRVLETSAAKSLGWAPFARMTSGGLRRTSADVLRDSPSSAKVTILTGTVRRVRFRDQTAIGVDVLTGEGRTESIAAKRGVILSAGTIQSPQILVQSGIGPACVIRELGIDRIHECPSVGANLSDHLIMPVIYQTSPADRFVTDDSSASRSSNLAEAGGTMGLEPSGGAGGEDPFQVHITPTHYLTYPSPRSPAAMTIGVNLRRPKSRGRIEWTKGAEPGTCVPSIDPGYLSDPSDAASMITAIRRVREIAQSADLASILGEELVPGPQRTGDEAILRSVQRYSLSLYHPCGTSAMGAAASSVVDHRLAVRGVAKLHVIDASVLPSVPSLNPNALVMAISGQVANAVCPAS